MNALSDKKMLQIQAVFKSCKRKFFVNRLHGVLNVVKK